MSFFGSNNQWGGLLKQAISNVETTFDTLLEQPETNRASNQDEETETYMDPISGMVTTVPKKKRGGLNASTPNSRPSTPKQPTATATSSSPLQRQQSDLSARLAAVMNEKKARSSTSSSRPTSIHSSQSVEPPSSSPSSLQQHEPSTAIVAADPESVNKLDGSIEPSKENLATKTDGMKDALPPTVATTVSVDDTNKASNGGVKDGNGFAEDKNSIDDEDNKIKNTTKDEKDDTVSQDNSVDIQNSDDSTTLSARTLDSLDKDSNGVESADSQLHDSKLLDAISVTSDSKSSISSEDPQTKLTNLDDGNLLAGTTEMHLGHVTEGAPQPLEEIDKPTSTNKSPADTNETTHAILNTRDDNDNKLTTPSLNGDTSNTVEPLPTTSSNPPNTTSNHESAPPETNNTSDKDRILAQREQQLLQAMETIAKLHDQIHGLQQDDDQATAHINSLQKRLQEQSTTQASSRNIKKLELSIQDLTKQLDSRDEQIQGLLKEGEKLSKNELKQTTTIKRLRAEKQDQDKILADTQKKLDKAIADLADLTTKSKRGSEGEKRAQDSIKMLTEMTERQTKHINKLETDSMHLKDQYQQLQAELAATLENLEKEKNKVKVESEQVHAAALEKEVAANGRLHKELTAIKDTAQASETKLRAEIRDLQITLQSLESQAGQREDHLRQELADIQMQLQKRDAHFDNISSNVEEETTPLLRQIEELQTQHSLVIKNRDQAEQSMNRRLQQAEKEHKQATEQLKTIKDEMQKLKDALADQQQRMNHSQQEKRTLETQMENTTLEIEALQIQLKERQQQLDDQKAQATKAADDIKKQYQKLMRERLQEEKKQWDSKYQQQQQQQQQQQRQQKQNKEEMVPKKSADTSSSPPSFTSGTIPTSRKEDDTSTTFKRLDSHSPSTSSRSSIDSGYTGVMNQSSYVPPTVGIDRMQMTIRQMENQLNFYQTQLQIATQSRDEISDELAAMSQEMDTLRSECRKMQDLQKEHEDVNRRYQASLELLGERTEQVEELRADIADVKEMYRTQIVEMVQKIDQLSSQK